MKKRLLVLGIITCMLGLTGCGNQNEAEPFISEEEAIFYADNLVAEIDQVVDQGQVEMVLQQNPELESVFTSWESAMEDLGDYNEILDNEVKVGADTATINVQINGTNIAPDGSPREATVEVIFNNDLSISSVTTNVKYTMGETMTKAALNTLLGMGTVFTILILISLIIACFGFIPKIQAAFSKKETAANEKAQAVESAVAQIAAAEELSDDTELVAVIAAAIAASEGAASADGVVIRSIKRANSSKWARANY